MNETFKENPIVRYWQIILVMGSITFGGGSLYFQIGALQSALADEKAKTEDIREEAHETEKTLVKVEANQKAFKEDITEIKDRLREQDKKLDRIIEKLSESD